MSREEVLPYSFTAIRFKKLKEDDWTMDIDATVDAMRAEVYFGLYLSNLMHQRMELYRKCGILMIKG